MLSNFPPIRGCLGTWDYMCPRPPARPASVHGSLQQQDRYIPSLDPPFSIPGACFQRERREDGDDMTRTLIFLGAFGCGPKIGANRAKDRRQAGRIKRMPAQMGYRAVLMNVNHEHINIPWNLHVNARVFRLILGHAFVRGDALREGRERFFMSRAILPSFLSVWILVDKKGSEDCDVGHGTSAANPILISEEQKSKEWVWRFVIGPPPYRGTHHCLTASFRLLGRRTKTVGAHSETQSLICRINCCVQELRNIWAIEFCFVQIKSVTGLGCERVYSKAYLRSLLRFVFSKL